MTRKEAKAVGHPASAPFEPSPITRPPPAIRSGLTATVRWRRCSASRSSTHWCAKRPKSPTLDTTRYVHTNRYVDALEAARPDEGYVYLDGGDTMMEPSTWEVVLRGVGATLQAVDKVLDGEVQNAFVACRPPGHHAETERAMGFCLFNNISIGARHAQKKHGLMRVAIVDFDVHHGNGTQEIFYSDPSVLYASTHQMPLFPGTGAARETGVGNIFKPRWRPATAARNCGKLSRTKYCRRSTPSGPNSSSSPPGSMPMNVIRSLHCA